MRSVAGRGKARPSYVVSARRRSAGQVTGLSCRVPRWALRASTVPSTGRRVRRSVSRARVARRDRAMPPGWVSSAARKLSSVPTWVPSSFTAPSTVRPRPRSKLRATVTSTASRAMSPGLLSRAPQKPIAAPTVAPERMSRPSALKPGWQVKSSPTRTW